MTENVLADSNVIIDIMAGDPEWSLWSANQFERLTGCLIINPIIYAELCYQKTSCEEVDQLMLFLGLGFQELPRTALFLASQAFRVYRQRNGSKTSPLPDFFIGAHAAVLKIPILTRDVSRYHTYFPGVEIICP